jgi:hypothetical protein
MWMRGASLDRLRASKGKPEFTENITKPLGNE